MFGIGTFIMIEIKNRIYIAKFKNMIENNKWQASFFTNL